MKIDVFKIKLLMAESELSCGDLAKRWGTGRQNVSLLLRRGTCTPKSAVKLAHALGVSVSDIVIPE